MTKQLSEKEVEALNQLKGQFEESVKYVQRILNEKYFPEKVEDEIGYVVRDWTTRDCGYQNDAVAYWLGIVADLKDRIEEDKEANKVVS